MHPVIRYVVPSPNVGLAAGLAVGLALGLRRKDPLLETVGYMLGLGLAGSSLNKIITERWERTV